MQKTYLGASQTDADTVAGDWSEHDNWLPLSIRSAAYSWTASGAGTDEYYLRTAASGDPGLTAPGNVQEAGANLAAGAAGSLAAGEWAFGDNDTLGYDTIYVRLADGADPDAKPAGHVAFTQRPVAGDDVRIPPEAAAISAGLDQAAVALGDVIVEEGYRATIGLATAYLRLQCARFEFAGGGVTFVDLTDSAISPVIHATAAATRARPRGLYLLGTALANLFVRGGAVGLAVGAGETSAVDNVYVTETGSVWTGEGVAISGDVAIAAGDALLRWAGTLGDLVATGGACRTEGAGALTNLAVAAGACTHNSTGATANVVQDGGLLDGTKSAAARTWTNVRHNGGELRYDPAVVTITTRQAPDHRVHLTATRP